VFPKLFTLPAFDLFGKNIGPLALHTYGALMAVAFLIGLWVASREARKAGLDVQRTTDLAIYTLIGGLVGARLLLAIIEWRYFSQHPAELSSLITSGGVFYGGFLGALPVAWWYARRYALPVWRTLDVLAPGLVMGQAIGRLGCFAAGCCYGMPASVPWAVTFKSIDAQRTVGTPLDVPLHPVQIYETLACLVIYGVLVWMAGRKRFHGQVACAYVALYAIARFFLEYYRGDEIRGFLRLTTYRFISTSQVIAVLLLLAAAAIAPYLLKTQRVVSENATAA